MLTDINQLVDGAVNQYMIQLLKPESENQPFDEFLYAELGEFMLDRFRVQHRDEGVRHDIVAAIATMGIDPDFSRLSVRVHALNDLLTSDDGINLLAAYKRAANILKKEDWHGRAGEIAQTGEEDPLALVDDPDMKAVVDARMAQKRANEASYTPEPAETDLAAALDAAEPKAAAAVEAEDFAGAMAALASLRAPIDRFFTEVMINDPDRDKRAARLDLLLRFRDAVHKVADFSRIEG